MRKFKLIIKGILLWLTTFIILLSICSVDSILNKGFIWLLGTIILDIVLILICIKTISEKEFLIVSSYKWTGLNIDED